MYFSRYLVVSFVIQFKEHEVSNGYGEWCILFGFSFAVNYSIRTITSIYMVSLILFFSLFFLSFFSVQNRLFKPNNIIYMELCVMWFMLSRVVQLTHPPSNSISDKPREFGKLHIIFCFSSFSFIVSWSIQIKSSIELSFDRTVVSQFDFFSHKLSNRNDINCQRTS